MVDEENKLWGRDAKYFVGGVIIVSIFVFLLISYISANDPNYSTNTYTPTITITPQPNPLEPSMRKNLIETNKVPEEAFSQLPKMPLDFLAVTNKFQIGQVSSDRVSEAYWKQPEFYPNWYPKGHTRYLEPKELGYSVSGYGSYPSEYLANVNSIDTFSITFWIMSDFTDEYYQGLKISPEYPDSVTMKANYYSDGTRTVNQNVTYVQNHLKVLSITPQEMVLEPARDYQIYEWNDKGQMIKATALNVSRFEYNWVRKVTITFQTINLQTGKYAIVFNFVPPSDNFSLKMSDKYLTRYKEAGTDISSGWNFGVFFNA
jgi:hypothetical protein